MNARPPAVRSRFRWIPATAIVAALAIVSTFAHGAEVIRTFGDPALLLGAPTARETLTYQGEIRFNGAPMNESIDTRLSFWSAPTAGSQLGATTVMLGVPVSNGRFSTSAEMGAIAPQGVDVFLQIEVRRSSTGGPYVTLGRQPVTGSPYTRYAEVSGVAAAPWAIGGGAVSWSGDVGIGTSAPAYRLEVTDNAATTARIANTAASTNGSALIAEISGTGFGGGTAAALEGVATATTGSTVGVSGSASSNSGIGVFAFAPSTSGATRGLLARASSPTGTALEGFASAATGSARAIYGRVTSPSAFAGYFEGGISHFSGTVGVGTTNPSDRVQIDAAAGESALRVRVDGATRLRVHDNGGVSVGVNVTPPANGLYVEGELRRSPRTRWVSLDFNAFTPNDSDYRYERSGNQNALYYTGAASPTVPSVFFSSPLWVPHGVVVTELRGLVTDSSGPERIFLRLLRRSLASGTQELMAEAATAANESPGQVPIATTNIGGATIDNENYAYFVEWRWNVTTSATLNDGQRVHIARVAYTQEDVP